MFILSPLFLSLAFLFCLEEKRLRNSGLKKKKKFFFLIVQKGNCRGNCSQRFMDLVYEPSSLDTENYTCENIEQFEVWCGGDVVFFVCLFVHLIVFVWVGRVKTTRKIIVWNYRSSRRLKTIHQILIWHMIPWHVQYREKGLFKKKNLDGTIYCVYRYFFIWSLFAFFLIIAL